MEKDLYLTAERNITFRTKFMECCTVMNQTGMVPPLVQETSEGVGNRKERGKKREREREVKRGREKERKRGREEKEEAFKPPSPLAHKNRGTGPFDLIFLK